MVPFSPTDIYASLHSFHSYGSPIGYLFLSPVHYTSPLSSARSWAFSGRGPLSFLGLFFIMTIIAIFLRTKHYCFYISTFMLQYSMLCPPNCYRTYAYLYILTPQYPPFALTYVGYSSPPVEWPLLEFQLYLSFLIDYNTNLRWLLHSYWSFTFRPAIVLIARI